MKAGDKVICIRIPRTLPSTLPPHERPQIDKIYIVKSVHELNGMIYIIIDNSTVGHVSDCFRKLDDDFGAKVCEEIEGDFKILEEIEKCHEKYKEIAKQSQTKTDWWHE